LKKYIYILIITTIFTSCTSKDDGNEYTPVALDLEIPEIFSNNIIPPVIPSDNPQTIEGVALGKRLFFDRILSSDQSISCAS